MTSILARYRLWCVLLGFAGIGAIVIASIAGLCGGAETASAGPVGRSYSPCAMGAIEFSFLSTGVTLELVRRVELLDPPMLRRLELLSREMQGQFLAMGMPPTGELRVRLLASGKKHLVAWPVDLKGHVRINSPDDALAFLQLFSSPSTCTWFPEYRYMEISPSDAVKRGPGDVQRDVFERLGLVPLSITQEAGVYRILRPVVVMQEGASAPLSLAHEVAFAAMIDESVAPDGDYSVQMFAKVPIPPDVARNFVSLPVTY